MGTRGRSDGPDPVRPLWPLPSVVALLLALASVGCGGGDSDDGAAPTTPRRVPAVAAAEVDLDAFVAAVEAEYLSGDGERSDIVRATPHGEVVRIHTSLAPSDEEELRGVFICRNALDVMEAHRVERVEVVASDGERIFARSEGFGLEGDCPDEGPVLP